MDIYILHAGEQIGPFSEETTHQMLKQGEVLINDLACRAGMTEWIPLHSVLYPAPGESSQASSASEPPAEPATGKQKAFLNYVGIPVAADLSKDQAAMLVHDVMENPKHASRVERWNEERLRLHPDLFAAELQAKKEERPQRFLELCQTEGAEALEGVTKAHCQVLLGYLDVKFPNWDQGKESEAAWNYFFPAVAEKFPQLVHAEWKEKLQYPKGPKVAPELKRRVPAAAAPAPKRKASSPVASLFKGLVLGLLIVALGVGGLYVSKHPEVIDQAKAQLAVYQAKFLKSTKSADQKSAAAPAPADQEPQSLPGTKDSPAPSPADTTAMPPTSAPAMAGTKEAEAGMDSVPAPELPEASPAPSNSAPSLFDPTPSTTDVGGAMAGDAAAVPAPKTTVTLMQPMELQLTYGKIKIPAGTQLPIVEQDGVNLKVRFQNQVLSVPANATDLGEGGLSQ